jgi:hypothetical protein
MPLLEFTTKQVVPLQNESLFIKLNRLFPRLKVLKNFVSTVETVTYVTYVTHCSFEIDYFWEPVPLVFR